MSSQLSQTESDMTKQTSTFPASANFAALPDDAHVRLPVVCEIYAMSRASVWRKVKDGSIPAPKKFSVQVTAWRVGDIRADLARRAAAC